VKAGSSEKSSQNLHALRAIRLKLSEDSHGDKKLRRDQARVPKADFGRLAGMKANRGTADTKSLAPTMSRQQARPAQIYDSG
jgi:hypothetical protein